MYVFTENIFSPYQQSLEGLRIRTYCKHDINLAREELNKLDNTLIYSCEQEILALKRANLEFRCKQYNQQMLESQG
jgi:hypothetical protein